MKKWLTVAQVLLIAIFLGCAGYVGKYFYDSHMAKSEYISLSEEVEKNTATDAQGNYIEHYAENGMLLSYYELYEKNHDMVGWLKIKGTAVDYPVTQGKDNDYYLRRDFYKNKQYAGIPFIDCDTTPASLNNIIYAHNMKNGTMFADIKKYASREYYEKHHIINYDTLYERGRYAVIAVFKTNIKSKNAFNYQNFANIETEEAFNEYVKRAKALSVFNIDETAEYGDKLLTLSTCNSPYSGERVVVVAKRIK